MTTELLTQAGSPKTTLNGIDYMTDEKGRLIPVDAIKPIDMLRDETVINIADMVRAISAMMAHKKDLMFELIYDFLELSAAEYGTEYGGKKGNVTLPSFDGKFKVQVSVSDTIVFDERLQIAKNLIDECIGDWSVGSDTKIMTLVNDAFQVDKEGKVSTYRVLGLRRHDFDDPKWLDEMQAISDAMQVTSSKEYIRVYERDEHDKYIQIPLDFSKV